MKPFKTAVKRGVTIYIGYTKFQVWNRVGSLTEVGFGRNLTIIYIIRFIK